MHRKEEEEDIAMDMANSGKKYFDTMIIYQQPPDTCNPLQMNMID
jgi:hypothetical protein